MRLSTKGQTRRRSRTFADALPGKNTEADSGRQLRALQDRQWTLGLAAESEATIHLRSNPGRQLQGG